jgi:hypothetical protein
MVGKKRERISWRKGCVCDKQKQQEGKGGLFGEEAACFLFFFWEAAERRKRRRSVGLEGGEKGT